MSGPETATPEVVIVGGGPSGLTAAATLAGQVDGEVLVLERERQAGGIPRHSDHTGYGIRDLRRLMTGPAYAEHLVERALGAGARIHTGATVTDVQPDRTLSVTSPEGLRSLRPRALILATGARERPRSARVIAGDRPDGVYTTGHLQNLVHLERRPAGRRAVVVGGELVSWSAVLTLRHAGCRTVLMTTTFDRPESYAVFNGLGRAALRVPVAARTRVVAIHGKERVEGITTEDLDTGERAEVACDTVVLTGDWVPDNELARMAGIDIAAGSRSPVVDASLRTSVPGVFAVGNVAHPVDTADVAALDGRHVAASVLRWLHVEAAAPPGVPVTVLPPLRWVAPALLRADDPEPARGRLLTWTDVPVRTPVVEVRQAGELVGRHRVPWPAAPGRVFRIPARVLDGVDRRAGEVTLSLG